MLKGLVIVIAAVFLLPVLAVAAEQPDAWDGEVLDVFIIDGQSNAAYGTDNNVAVVNQDFQDAPSKKLLYYGTDSAPIGYVSLSNPTYDTTYESYSIHEMYDSGWKIGGYEPGLAYTISQRTNHDVLILNLGVNGATVSQLTPEGVAGQYGKPILTHALEEVKDQYDTINMIGFMWAQGESDRLTSIPAYESDFMKVFGMMEEYGAKKCYIVESRSNWGNSVAAQVDLMHKYSNVLLGTSIANTFTTDNGLLISDGVHYSQHARDIIAKIIGEKVDLNEPENSGTYEILGAVVVVSIVAVIVAAAGLIFIRRAD